MRSRIAILYILTVLSLVLASSCTVQPDGARIQTDGHETDSVPLNPVALGDGEKLQVVATTSIVADVVSNVGGDAIELTSLMPLGADPHSFTATPADLRTLNDADVIFMNGLGLEESLMPVLENLDSPVPILSVSDGIDALTLGDGDSHEQDHGDEEHGAEDHSDVEHGDEEHSDEVHGDEEHSDEMHGDEEHGDHHHGDTDPHAWFSVSNVRVWTQNIAHALEALDPSNAEAYQNNADDYLAQLETLDAEIEEMVESIPPENRKLVTDHIALGYLARDHGFETVGTVLPSLSTLAAASAQEMAELQQAMIEEGVKAIFVSTSVNPQTASQLANDLGIPVVDIYTGSLSPADGPASTYIDLMRYDVSQIAEALR